MVLNGRLSLWYNIGSLLFLIYINTLSEGLTANPSLFADDVLNFFVVNNINLSVTNLNSDLSKVNVSANQWKMTFSSDSKKQAHEVEIKKTSRPPLNFDNNYSEQVQFPKHLGVYLDGKLDFREHFQNMFKKINKTISLLRKLQNNLPRAQLVAIYIAL